ncbi:restriction endonuclease subunit S [Ileibacterium valens]|uniref:restriction endonuclease subunit S n=2 Tax=Ileibacterium valens TaxID=1862668 RepID=UPI0024B99337|nr:restriction endonuclease subunit S [Ileibacterium valens]
MEKDKLEPKLRFPGFTEPWEHRKLATIATFAKGRGYSKNDLTDRGTPLILYGRLYTNYSSAIETVDTYAKPLIGSVYSKGGEVIVPASGETAEDIARASAVISKGFLLGGDLNIINPNSEIDPVFLALQLSNGYLKKELASKAQGKSVVHIHNSDLENLQIIYPSLVEQMKVSTCIRVFEHLITLHQRKEEELQKLKKGLLQKMFPKDGESVPEVRFPNFTDSWEQRKLGDIARFVNGRAYKQDELLSKGKYPILRVGNFYTNDAWYYSDLELDEKLYAKEGDLLYTWSATFGPHIWNGSKVIYHYHIWKVILSDKLEPSFALWLLEADKNHLLSGSNGSTMIHITKAGMENKEVAIPRSLSEQKNIGEFLNNLKQLITLHQRKTEELKKLKKALLQQMFV